MVGDETTGPFVFLGPLVFLVTTGSGDVSRHVRRVSRLIGTLKS